MALAHRCPDGTTATLVRSGPLGQIDGSTFTCPNCGWHQDSPAMMRAYIAARDTIVQRLSAPAPDFVATLTDAGLDRCDDCGHPADLHDLRAHDGGGCDWCAPVGGVAGPCWTAAR